MKESLINISVLTDEKKFTKEIKWNATDTGVTSSRNANAMLLGFWDADENAGMTLDLWTDKMLVDDMKIFIHHTLLRLSELAASATADKNSGDLLRDFAAEYAHKNNLLKQK